MKALTTIYNPSSKKTGAFFVLGSLESPHTEGSPLSHQLVQSFLAANKPSPLECLLYARALVRNETDKVLVSVCGVSDQGTFEEQYILRGE